MLVRASSCVGNSWCHAMFKVKYCHKVFAIEEVRLYVYDQIKDPRGIFHDRIPAEEREHISEWIIEILELGRNRDPEIMREVMDFEEGMALSHDLIHRYLVRN